MSTTTLREKIKDELIIIGRPNVVRNIYFSHRTESGRECWVIQGNNSKIIGFALVSDPTEEHNIDIIC